MQQTTPPTRQERRVRRTRALILNGLIELMQKKPVKDISVRELADLVDINRSTFYLHYTDVYDLLEQTENDLMDQFLSILDPEKKNITWDEFANRLKRFFTVLSANQPLCRALMSPNGDIAFVRKLESLIAENGLRTLRTISDEKNFDADDLQYVIGFFLSGCIGMVDMWLQNDCKQPVDHMSALAMQLLQTGIRGIAKR